MKASWRMKTENSIQAPRTRILLSDATPGAYGILATVGELIQVTNDNKFIRLGFNMLNDKMLKKFKLKLKELPVVCLFKWEL